MASTALLCVLIFGISLTLKFEISFAHTAGQIESNSRSDIVILLYQIIGDLYELQSENKIMAEKIEMLEGNQASLKTSVVSAEGNIMDYGEKINMLEENLGSLETVAKQKMAYQVEKFKSLEGKQASLETSIASAEEKNTDHAEKIEMLMGKSVMLETSAKDHAEKVEHLEGKQALLKEDAMAHAEKIEMLVNKTVSLEASAKDQTEKVEILERTLETFETSAERKMGSLTEKTETLEGKMRESDAFVKGQAVAFSAAAGTLYIKGNQPIAFNHVILNMGGGYDVSSGKFTCPLSGIYMITFFIGHRKVGGGYYQLVASLVVNDAEILSAQAEGFHDFQDLQGGNAVVVKLNKGDQVCVKPNSGDRIGSNTGLASSFSGVLLYPSD